MSLSTNGKIVGCTLALVSLPVGAVASAATSQLAWNGILRHYLTALPTLGFWDAWAVHVAVLVFVKTIEVETEAPVDREPKPLFGLTYMLGMAFRYGVVWFAVRYVVGPS